MSNKKVTIITFIISLIIFSVMVLIGSNVTLEQQTLFFVISLLVVSPIFIGISMYITSYKNGFLYPLLLPLMTAMVVVVLMTVFKSDVGNFKMMPCIIMSLLESFVGIIGIVIGIKRRKKNGCL